MASRETRSHEVTRRGHTRSHDEVTRRGHTRDGTRTRASHAAAGSIGGHACRMGGRGEDPRRRASRWCVRSARREGMALEGGGGRPAERDGVGDEGRSVARDEDEAAEGKARAERLEHLRVEPRAWRVDDGHERITLLRSGQSRARGGRLKEGRRRMAAMPGRGQGGGGRGGEAM